MSGWRPVRVGDSLTLLCAVSPSSLFERFLDGIKGKSSPATEKERIEKMFFQLRRRNAHERC